MQPLAGITVISVEAAIAAPFASRQLADLGARVIKIERPGRGDFARSYDRKANGLCSHFVWVNRGKESLTLDLKHEAGRSILNQLLTGADIFIHNLAPGAMDRLGFASDRLRRELPRLIICTISGYGGDGPYRDKKAYDLLIQAEAGLLSITGTAAEPVKAGISIADNAAGTYAFSGILTALLARGQTGQGTVIEISMLEALAEWMGYPLYYAMDGQPPPRAGAAHAAIAPYGPFAAGDGGTIMLGVQNEREWLRFCQVVLAQPALAGDRRFHDNSARVRHRPALQAAIEGVFSQLTRAEILARLDAAGIANAEMRDMNGVRAHPQLAARGRWRTVASPAGPLPALLPPATIAGVEPVMGAIPALGEHTAAILAELGYSAAAIAGLRAQEVV